jgi:mannose/cellobiose epimerase-like protein (N-acyl-D-glucosamine 2-epimerase family)
MLAIGACSLLAGLTNEEEWLETGARFIRHILDKHVNLGQFAGLQLHDFVEFIDRSGAPWREDERVLSDPGHALEFVGFASKLLLLLRAKERRSAAENSLIDKCVELLPLIFVRNFHNGFNRSIGGMCKAFDLVSRRPINADMPWWNLPETIRAAAELLLFCPHSPRKAEILKSLADCSNGFFTRFVNRKVHLMAYQTVGPEGRPVEVIPATPDADPGYHPGLSIIDFLETFRSLQTAGVG